MESRKHYEFEKWHLIQASIENTAFHGNSPAWELIVRFVRSNEWNPFNMDHSLFSITMIFCSNKNSQRNEWRKKIRFMTKLMQHNEVKWLVRYWKINLKLIGSNRFSRHFAWGLHQCTLWVVSSRFLSLAIARSLYFSLANTNWRRYGYEQKAHTMTFNRVIVKLIWQISSV